MRNCQHQFFDLTLLCVIVDDLRVHCHPLASGMRKAWLLFVLVLAVSDCRRPRRGLTIDAASYSPTATVARPVQSPSDVLAEVKTTPFVGHPYRVKGVVKARRGGTEIQCGDLDAGKDKLVFCMKVGQCFNGPCAQKAPAEGDDALLDCVGGMIGKTPAVVDCQRVP
jgi:hypothetical protein